MSIRAYKLINGSERAAVTARLTEGVQRWTSLHTADEIQAQCVVVLPEEAPSGRVSQREWFLATRSSQAVLAMGLPPDWPRGLAGLVLTERPAATLDPAGMKLMREMGVGWIEELGKSVLDALIPPPSLSVAAEKRTAERALEWTRSRSPVEVGKAAEGWIQGTCALGAHLELLFVVWPSTALTSLASPTRPNRSPGALEPLSRALQSEAVVLDAIVGEAELALEDLRSLTVGDVLKLDRKISQPLQVRVLGGGGVCAARLGASKGRMALQLSDSRVE